MKIPESREQFRSEWSFTLTRLQRIANPPGILILFIGGLSVELALIRWTWRSLEVAIFTIPLILVCAVMLYGCMRRRLGPTAKSKIIIKDGVLGYSNQKTTEWIPREGINRVSPGLFNCSIISMISGHVLTVPREITETSQFKAFLAKSELSRPNPSTRGTSEK
jgi:hypothetical protein